MLEPVIFFFVSLARVGVWLLFNRLLALLVALFYVIREFDMLLHRTCKFPVDLLKYIIKLLNLILLSIS